MDTPVIRCPACGAGNRVPLEKVRAGLNPICGRCKAPMPIDVRPVTVTDASFTREVDRWRLPVLLDLWAPWCGPCRMLAPVLDELAGALAGRVRIAKLNVDENPVSAARFQARGIPLLVVLVAGHEVDRLAGLRSRAEILRHLEPVLT